MHGDLCKHLGIDSSTDPDRYSNLFLNAYINRPVHANYFKMIWLYNEQPPSTRVSIRFKMRVGADMKFSPSLLTKNKSFLASVDFCRLMIAFANVWTQIRTDITSTHTWIHVLWHCDSVPQKKIWKSFFLGGGGESYQTTAKKHEKNTQHEKK